MQELEKESARQKDLVQQQQEKSNLLCDLMFARLAREYSDKIIDLRHVFDHFLLQLTANGRKSSDS